jgi:hypothetical protein
MRLEATVPDARGNAVSRLADELGLSRSQIVDEALSLFLKAVLEIRRGKRLVTLDPRTQQPACELATPTLSALEWAMAPEALEMSPAAVAKVAELTVAQRAPSKRLRAAARRHRT